MTTGQLDPINPLDQAIVRLAEFRATWETGDVICEASKLTADDLDVILASLRAGQGNPVMRELR